MLLAWIILLFITICALVNFKKTFIIWMPFQMLFNAQVALKYTPPAMSLNLGIALILFCIYFFIYKNKSKTCCNERFILGTAVIVYSISYLLSFVVSIAPISSGINAVIKFFLMTFGLMYIFQKLITTKEDIHLFVRACIIVVFLIVGLAIFESIFKDNPILNYVYNNSPHDETTRGRMWYIPPSIRGTMAMRYGMVRAYSFFGIPIEFGCACAFLFFLLMLVYRNNFFKDLNIKKKTLQISIILSFIGIFLANSKTAYVGIIFLLFGLFSIKQILNIKVIVPLLIGIFVFFYFFPEYILNFTSLFDEDVAEEGGGSTVAGREIQFAVALRMFEMNPILGNGPGSIDVLKEIGNNSDILGAESSWMQVLPERGIMGAISYIIFYLSIFKRCIVYVPVRVIGGLLLGLFIMETATGIINAVYFMPVIIIIYKLYKFNHLDYAYRNNNNPQNY